MSSLAFLVTELQSLASETRRKHPEIREAAEKSLSILRSSPEQATSSLAADGPQSSDLLRPVFMGCATKNAKVVAISLGSLQRLIVLKAVPSSAVPMIINTMTDAMSQGVDIQLKVLQTLVSLFTGFPEIHGELLGDALLLCFKLQESKIAVVSSTAAATLRQLVMFIVDKMVDEDRKQPEPSTATPTQLPDGTTKLLTPSTRDAFSVFEDLCLLANSERPHFLKLESLHKTFALELIESVLTNYHGPIRQHDELILLLRHHLCPLLLKALSDRPMFPLTLRCTRVVFILLKQFMPELYTEAEVFLVFLIKLVGEEGESAAGEGSAGLARPQWMRVLAMEIIRGLCSDTELVRTIWSHYDSESQESSSQVFASLVSSLKRLISEKPNLLGMSSQMFGVGVGDGLHAEGGGAHGVVEGVKGMVSGVAGVVSMGMGMGGGGPAGLSVEGSVMKVQCIDQLDKADAPPIPETYIYLLASQSICTLCEGFSSFVTPIYSSVVTQRAREAGETAVRAPPALGLEALAAATPPLLDANTLNHLHIVQNIISSSWPALLASLTFLLSTNLSDGLFVDVVFGAVQGLINVSGILGLSTPRDALFTSLSKFAIPARVLTSLEGYSGYSLSYGEPPMSPRVGTSMSALSDLTSNAGGSGAAGGGGGAPGHHQPPGLSERNYACLKVLVNCAMFLAGSLGESWFWVLEVMQNAEYVITAKGIGVSGGGSGPGVGVSSVGMGRSGSSKPGSRVVSMIGSPQLGGAASGGNQPKHPLLVDLDGENLYKTIQRLFESTTKALEDEAFGHFVRALCKLSWEMVGMQSSGGLSAASASSATLTVATGGVNESLESLNLSPNAEALHRRRVSGIHIPRNLRSGDFGISKLLTVSLLNIHRLIYRSPSIAWDPTTSHLLSIIRDENTSRKEKERLGAPQAVRVQAAKVLDEVLVVSLKNLGSGIGMGDKKADVQRQVLDVLGRQVILIPEGGMGVNSSMVEVELRKMGLETLHEIVQNSAHTLVVGWERIFEMLGSVCLPTALHQAGPSVPSSPLMSRWKPSSSNTNSPAIGHGYPSERSSATLVKIAFQSLTLVCDSVSSLEPDHLRLCIITLGQFGRQPDTNIALTAATSLLWAVSDAIQSKRKTLSESEPAHRTYSELWLFLLGEILGLCVGNGDERKEVRDGAIQTLFRALMFYGGTLSLGEWEECVWGVLVPLFEKLGATAIHHEEIPSVPTSPTLTATGSISDREQSWDDSRILAFHSIGSIFHDFLSTRLIHLGSFSKVWDFLVSRVQEAVLWDNRPVSSPALRALEKAIKAAGLAAGGSTDLEDATAVKGKVVDACERAWQAFDEIGDTILKKQNEIPKSPSSHSTSSLAATKKFTQESLVSFVDVIQRTREVERGIQAHEWELPRLERLMSILKGILTYPSSPDYRPDIDSLSPVQTVVLETVNGIDLSASGVSSLVMRDMSEYATLAFLAAFDAQATSQTQTPPKRITYIALSKKAMPLLVDLYLRFKDVSAIYSDGTVESLVAAYSIPIKMKYDCPASSKFGKDAPLWKTATSSFLRVVKECLPQLNSLKDDIPLDRAEGTWRQVIDVFRGAILADCSIAESFPLDVQEAEENFDLALIASLEIDVLPYLGDSRVPDDLLRQLAKVLHQGSSLYDADVGDSRSSSPITESLRQTRDFGSSRHTEGSYGSTDLGSPLPRERFSYWCLDLLFLMCSDFCKDQEPLRKRVAALSLPSLLNRCHGSLTSYVADEMIRGGLPFPRAREEELLYILRKLLDLSLWPGSLWAAFSDNPSHFSSEQPAIDTSLSPSELVADAVKRSSIAHLFHLYSILCDIGSLPRKAPTTWVLSPKGSTSKLPPPRRFSNSNYASSTNDQPDGIAVEMDARVLARECLQMIGKELGVSR